MKKALIIILLACYAVILQDARGIWEPSEGRYTCVAVQMIRSGDWMYPHLNDDRFHWTKPPLTYWAIAASIKLFGFNPFAARLPNALAFFFTILLVYRLGSTFVPRSPWLPALIYATSLFPFVAANIVTTDGILTLFETAGMTFFILSIWPDGRSNKNYAALLGWIFFGLAFLTKGPPALIPFISLFVFYLAEGRKMEHFRLMPVSGFILFFVTGCTWYIRVIHEKPEMLQYYFSVVGYFLSDQRALKIATGEQNRNPQWYGALAIYLPTLLIGTLPWSRPVWRGLKQTIEYAVRSVRTRESAVSGKDVFLLCWFLCPLVVFFIAKTRLALYILPLFIPLSIFAARKVDIGSLKRKKNIYILAGWCCLLLALRGASAFFPSSSDNRMLADRIKSMIHADDPIEEIVFVESKPHLGLSLYFNAEVERIRLAPHRDIHPPDEGMMEELSSFEPGRLWIVPRPLTETFTGTVTDSGLAVEAVGTINGRNVYDVFVDGR